MSEDTLLEMGAIPIDSDSSEKQPTEIEIPGKINIVGLSERDISNKINQIIDCLELVTNKLKRIEK